MEPRFSSSYTPTATISTCDGKEKDSHVTGYTDVEFIIKVGWVGGSFSQPAT